MLLNLNHPIWFNIPRFLLKIFFGSMTKLLLANQQIISKRLIDNGFEFKYSTISTLNIYFADIDIYIIGKVL